MATDWCSVRCPRFAAQTRRLAKSGPTNQCSWPDGKVSRRHSSYLDVSVREITVSGLSVYDAAEIWASSGKDEDQMFGYSEAELQAALDED